MILILLMIMSSLSFSGPTDPEYFRYQILVTDKTSSSVTKSSFEFIPNLISHLYFEELKALNLTVEIDTNWEKPFFSAWANPKNPSTYVLSFWGGLARIPGMTDHAHALTACHELGHVLGGKPKIKIEQFLWSSSEGQSDYFATGLCLKKYFSMLERLGRLKIPSNIPESLFTRCRMTYSEDLDFKICLNSMEATVAFSSMLNHLRAESEAADLESYSRDRVKTTLFDSYPSLQCRVDTLIQGALCSAKDFPCEKGIGSRPACWFISYD